MKRRNPKKILLFDIDGTLLLTGGAGKIAIEQTFEKLFGIPDAWGDTVPDGKTDPLIFEEIAARRLKRPLTAKEHTALYKHYIACFKICIQNSPRFRLMPGVSDLLKILTAQKQFLLGIQTGNFEDVAWIKLKKGKLEDYFDFGGFGSDSHDREKLVRKAIDRAKKKLRGHAQGKDIFVIGDAPQDILAGRALGVRTIAVATGNASKAKLAAAKPHHLLDDLTDIPHFLSLISA